MCPWPSAGCPAWSPDAGVQATFGVSYVGIQDPDFGSRFLPQPLPGQPEQVPAHAWAKASGSWAVLPDLQLDPPRGCWALGVQSPRGLEAKLLRSGSSWWAGLPNSWASQAPEILVLNWTIELTEA